MCVIGCVALRNAVYQMADAKSTKINMLTSVSSVLNFKVSFVSEVSVSIEISVMTVEEEKYKR